MCALAHVRANVRTCACVQVLRSCTLSTFACGCRSAVYEVAGAHDDAAAAAAVTTTTVTAAVEAVAAAAAAAAV